MSDEKITNDKVVPIGLAKEMRTSFLDYAMSVIVSRALPDVRDGLKPVHRRILYAMNDLGMHSDKPFKKSARIVGDVIGKYHPHGDSAVYGTMVRLAQDFSIRNMLIEGHGNFGSIDGDGAAAMRYTEARMSKIAMEMVRDLNKDTVDFQDNYDGSETEPSVLPARFPNLLVNGATGIAVGMTTNIPTHNLREVISGTIAVLDNPEIEISELMEDHIKGPDFPTGALILGRSGIRKAYTTGNGSVIMRARTEIEEYRPGRYRIIVTEIPYQVNKSVLVERIAVLVREKKLEGITDLRDESNREGIRIVIEVGMGVNVDVVLNNLFKQTSLQSSFGVNMLALVDGKPEVLNLKQVIEYYIKHQEEIIYRRTKFDLEKAQARAHILEGLRIAIDNIDEVIKIIRYGEKPKEELIERFTLTDIQAQAILDMRLKQITQLEGSKIVDELNALLLTIEELQAILNDNEKIRSIIKEELQIVSDKFGDDRRSSIEDGILDIEDEDLIPEEDIIITLTNKGYIKRVSVDTYRVQNRGGKGIKGMNTTEDDFVEYLLTTNTHMHMMFFTNKGKAYRIKGYRIPEFSRTAKGLPIINLLPMEEGEFVNTIIPIESYDTDEYLFFATKKGTVKRTALSEFESIRVNGKIALTLRDDDEVLGVRLTDGTDEVILASSEGKAIRFLESEVREMGRTAAGVRGMTIPEGYELVGLTRVKGTKELLSVTEFGYGKRTDIDEYRQQTRGGKGSKTINTTAKNGQLIGVRALSDEESQDLFIITNEGIIIRMPVGQIAKSGRATQGVRLIRLNGEQKAVTVSLAPKEDDEDDESADTVVEATAEVIAEETVETTEE